jgi:hypothetical protein
MNKIKIPNQPEITETSPGHIWIDQTELDQYHKDMETAYKDFTHAMQGAENDPDEIIRRLMGIFK